MTTARCPTCGHRIPEIVGKLTERELSMLAYWWLTDSVKKAAARAGVAEQRGKNLLAQARNRNRVTSNDDLLALHFPAVRSFVDEISAAKPTLEEAA